jgi:NAD+ kinase
VDKSIGIVVKSDMKALRTADQLESWLIKRDANVVRRENSTSGQTKAPPDKNSAPPDLDAVFVLGGDGTFLSAVRWIGNHATPILGIKFGEVGFLAETSEENLFEVARTVLSGTFSTRPRMRLDVQVETDGQVRYGETVLNDVVINKGTLARLACIQTFINDHYLTTYRADGLIVATPTGSTAYSLAAGGPVVHPEVPGIIMTPICPFTLTNRPLVVPDAFGVKLRLEEKVQDIVLTVDGQAGLPIDEGDIIRIRKSGHPVHLITLPGRDYFDLLKAKLSWSGGRV